jgi:translation initiation factor eIF-2B subunit delta
MLLLAAAGKGAAGGDTSAQPQGSKGKKDNALEKKGSQASERKGSDKSIEKEKKKEVPAPRLQFDDKERVAKAKRRSLVEQTETKNRVELFRHLPQFVYGTQLPSLEAKFFQDDATHPHPAVYQV